MRTRSAIALGLVVALAVGVAIAADEKADTKLDAKALRDVKCPVSGKPVNPEAKVEFEKGLVFMCCENCPTAFKKDIEGAKKFVPKAHLQMVQTKQLIEVACPFTGKPMNPDAVLEVGGVKVAFCCLNCKGKAEKAKGDEQVSLIFGDVSKGFKTPKEIEEAKKGDAKKSAAKSGG